LKWRFSKKLWLRKAPQNGGATMEVSGLTVDIDRHVVSHEMGRLVQVRYTFWVIEASISRATTIYGPRGIPI
jgi:hypothetical protein